MDVEIRTTNPMIDWRIRIAIIRVVFAKGYDLLLFSMFGLMLFLTTVIALIHRVSDPVNSGRFSAYEQFGCIFYTLFLSQHLYAAAHRRSRELALLPIPRRIIGTTVWFFATFLAPFAITLLSVSLFSLGAEAEDRPIILWHGFTIIWAEVTIAATSGILVGATQGIVSIPLVLATWALVIPADPIGAGTSSLSTAQMLWFPLSACTLLWSYRLRGDLVKPPLDVRRAMAAPAALALPWKQNDNSRFARIRHNPLTIGFAILILGAFIAPIYLLLEQRSRTSILALLPSIIYTSLPIVCSLFLSRCFQALVRPLLTLPVSRFHSRWYFIRQTYAIHFAWSLGAILTKVAIPSFDLYVCLSLTFFSLGVSQCAAGFLALMHERTDLVLGLGIGGLIVCGLPYFFLTHTNPFVATGMVVIGIFGCFIGPILIFDAIDTAAVFRRK